MKKQLLSFLLLPIIISSCSNNADRAKRLIDLELSKEMNDYSSYESVEYGNLDSVVTKFDEDEFLLSDTLAVL